VSALRSNRTQALGMGTIRAQMHLRQLCVDRNMLTVSEPEVLVAGADEKSDGAGRLTHSATRHFVGLLMEALLEWTRKVRQAA